MIHRDIRSVDRQPTVRGLKLREQEDVDVDVASGPDRPRLARRDGLGYRHARQPMVVEYLLQQ